MRDHSAATNDHRRWDFGLYRSATHRRKIQTIATESPAIDGLCQASAARKGKSTAMAICDTCGNDYEKAFTVTRADGQTATFDSIECAAGRIGTDMRPLRLSHPGPRGGGQGEGALLRALRPQISQHRHQRPLSDSSGRIVMKTQTRSSSCDTASRPRIRCGRAGENPGLADIFGPLNGRIYGPAPAATELGSIEITAEQRSAP